MTTIWTNQTGVTWHFDDGKLNFEEWVNEDPARADRWSEGVEEHLTWTAANPGKKDFEHEGSKCGKLTQEWVDYCNAIEDFNL